jgi:hypothetical protein
MDRSRSGQAWNQLAIGAPYGEAVTGSATLLKPTQRNTATVARSTNCARVVASNRPQAARSTSRPTPDRQGAIRGSKTITTRLKLAISLVGVALIATGCSGSGSRGSAKVSVFSVEPGECFVSPGQVHAQLTTLDRTPCTRPHNQEAYAKVAYTAADGSTASAYPGDTLLSQFAQGACAQRFGGYVGVDYLDSSLFFTYLLPSPRSWENADDRNVICFVTTTGGSLTSSVKGSRK